MDSPEELLSLFSKILFGFSYRCKRKRFMAKRGGKKNTSVTGDNEEESFGRNVIK